MRKIPAPPIDKLKALYLDQQLSTRAIAAIYGVSKHPVEHWLHDYGIPTRPSGRGLEHQGVAPPSKEELYRLVHIEHKSYKQIAARYGVDYTAIPHWLTKHDIPRPNGWDTRRKGNIPQLPDEPTLRHLYLEQEMSTSRIGSLYEVCGETIASLCRSYGISVRNSGFNGGQRFECLDGHLVRSVYEQRVDDWLYQHGISHVYEPVLPFDRRSRADFLANGWYIEVWGVVGSARYKARRARKHRLYIEHNIPIIEIPAHAFDAKRNRMWERRLKQCLTNPQEHEPSPQLFADNSSHSLDESRVVRSYTQYLAQQTQHNLRW